MVSKLHQVIPWWLPTVLLSHTQSQMTESKNLFKHFCRMRFWFLVPSERGFLTFKFMGIRPWLLILLERLGLSWAQNVLAPQCWFCVQIVFSSWESSALEGEECRLTARRGQCPGGGAPPSWPLLSSKFLIITLLPLTLSPCPECDFQPATSAFVDCCSYVYSLVGFLYMNVGLKKKIPICV